VDGRKSNKLPEGMGKKIVEALKRQSGSVTRVQSNEQDSSFDDLINTHIAENDQDTDVYNEDQTDWEDDYQETPVNVSVNNDYQEEDESFDENYEYDTEENSASEEFQYQELIDEDDLDSYDYYKPDTQEEDYTDERVYSNHQSFEDEMSEIQEKYVPEKPARIPPRQKAPSRPKPQQVRQNRQPVEEKPVQQKPESSGLYVDTSSNIEVLMGLVSKLPSGVTRQTGAQIIRQTMEAIGFSMNKVLKEAQFAQTELAQAIRDNINTIEEYRNNIKTLEKDVQKYRRKAEELEDLISLFILSEKDKK